ncbi:MAG TPA: hypothetical protein VF175_15855 [Lacipirellula sp.]
MNRRLQLLTAITAFAALATLLSSQPLRADPPDVIASYRFAPQISRIHLLGNPGHELNVYGTFDFTRGWEYHNNPPSIARYADFENVHAWAHNPLSLAPSLSVDAIFNLSGLKGVELPAASIFEVYKFAGKNHEGDDVEFFASVLGPWLYLRGQSTFANHPDHGWQMNAFARQRPFADFDEDGDVDAEDLAAWTERAGVWTGMNDANGDNFQTGADLLHWQQQLGETPPAAAAFEAAINAATASSATAIPEPHALTLLAAAAAALVSSHCERPTPPSAPAPKRSP